MTACLNTASILGKIDGIDVAKLYRKVAYTYLVTRDTSTAKNVSQGYEMYELGLGM